MMADRLLPTVRDYICSEDISKRYLRISEAEKHYEMETEKLIAFASAAGAICRLPKITLICKEKLEEYMKHLYKVPGTAKYVQKKFVRMGEGSVLYSIGRHRFVEMARAAGAVYKLGDNSSVLVNLDIFDEYMEQFREQPVPMKNPLWKAQETDKG